MYVCIYIYIYTHIDIYIYIYIYIHKDVVYHENIHETSSMSQARTQLGCSGSGMWCFRMSDFNLLFSPPSPIYVLGVKSPHLQLLRVNKQLFSNPTSSNTTSLNSRTARYPYAQGCATGDALRYYTIPYYIILYSTLLYYTITIL